MALFLAVLGGAAVVEVHRAITGGGNKDLHVLKLREEALHRQLQEIQKELEKAKSQRELTEQEASQLTAINEQLQRDKDELDRRALELQNQNEELSQRAERLLERQQLLEQCAESLKLENGILLQQFERLKVKHDEETNAFQEQFSALKQSVGTLLQKFTEGALSAAQFTESLAEIGVELRIPEGELSQVPQRLAAATTTEERTQVLQTVEMQVSSSWMTQMKLVASSPTRVARLMAGSHRESATTSAPVAEQPVATPRSLEAAALKLTSHAVRAEEGQSVVDTEQQQQADTIPALRAADEAETTVAAAAAAAAAAPVEKEVTSKSRSIMFRPIKRTNKQKQAVVELDVPLNLPFDVKSQDVEAEMSGNSLVAM